MLLLILYTIISIYVRAYDWWWKYVSINWRLLQSSRVQGCNPFSPRVNPRLYTKQAVNQIICFTYYGKHTVHNVSAASSRICLQCLATFTRAHTTIEKVQKWLTKLIYSLSHLSHQERQAAISIEPLHELKRLKGDSVTYYKCLKNLVPLPSDV